MRRKKTGKSKRSTMRSIRKNQRAHLNYNSLEKRDLLTTFFVDSVMDDASGVADGVLTLREAVIAAETNEAFGDAVAGDVDGDQIRFSNEIIDETITLTEGELSITDDVALFGGTRNITIDANFQSRVFNINSTEHTVVRGLSIVNGFSTDAGGAVLISGAGTTTLNELTVTNSTSEFGGGGIATLENQVIILNSSLKSNNATGENGRGGALLVDSGRVRIADTIIAANTANQAGGGIEVIDGTLGIFDSTVGGPDASDGNRAGELNSAGSGNGGGIHVAAASSERITVSRSNLSNNVAAKNGGGLWNTSDRILFIRDSVIADNVAQGDAVRDGGGGIFNNGGTVRVRNAFIGGNIANGALGSGGGANSTDGLLSIIGSTASANTASFNGGGIEVVDGRLFVASSMIGGASASDGNVAGSDNVGDGGGIHISGVNNTITGVRSSTVQNNIAGNSGGGIWNSSIARLGIVSSSILENVASGDQNGDGGGGIFNDAGRTFLLDSEIHGNQANGAIGSGGGIYSTAVNFNFSIGVSARNSIISGNVATAFGGGVKVVGGVYNFRSTTIGGSGPASKNLAGPVGSGMPGDGGGIHASSFDITSRITISAGSVVNNEASGSGGGVWIGGFGDGGSVLEIRDGTSIVDNVADSDDLGGGGIFNQRSGVNIFDSFISNNVVRGVTGSGGGFYSVNGTINLTRSIVFRNAAPSDGGALKSDGGRHVITDSVLSNNDAFNGNGGAISGSDINQNGFLVLSGSTVEGNVAEEGGGIWWFDDDTGPEIKSGSVIRDNRADSGQGGGLFLAGGDLMFIESSLNNNIAANDGGGLYMANGTSGEIRSSTFARNTAANGGGLFHEGLLFIGQSIFTGNRAIGDNSNGDGGAIFTSATGDLTKIDVVFAGNTPNDENSDT